MKYTEAILEEKLKKMLKQLKEWNKEADSALQILADNQQIIEQLRENKLSLTEATQQLMQELIKSYQLFINELHQQKQAVKKDHGRLRQSKNLVKTYLQQEQVSSFVDYDF